MTTLYVGPEVPEALHAEEVVHFPLIRIVPLADDSREIALAKTEWPRFSHLLYTSKVAVDLAAHYFPPPMPYQCIVAVGQATAKRLIKHGWHANIIADRECSEGVVDKLGSEIEQCSYLLWPHSAGSRTVIVDWLTNRSIPHMAPILYRTERFCKGSPPSLESFDSVYFTSPSTVDAFIAAYREIPPHMQTRCIGHVTAKHLDLTIKQSKT